MINHPNFNAVFDAYLMAQQARDLAPGYRRLQDTVRCHFVRLHGDLPLDQVTPDQIRVWLIWLRSDQAEPGQPPARCMSGGSVNTHYRMLKAFLTWCENEEYLKHSPARKVRRPSFEHTLPDVLTEREAVQLLESVRNDKDSNSFRDYCILLFFLDTGVRLAELANLRMDQVNLDSGYAKVMGKGRKERLVPIGLELRRALARYILKYRNAAADDEQALFINRRGRRLEYRGVSKMVVCALQQYVPRKLRRSGPHTLRHTFATFNIRKTRDIKSTSMILGHSTTRITERYIHLTGADVLRNAEGSPMDALIRDEHK